MPRTKTRFRNLYNVKEPPQWLPSIKLGIFKADNISLYEAAIDDVVLRIKLKECIKKKAKEKKLKHPKQDITSNPLKTMIQKSFRSKILNENNGHKAPRTKPEVKNNLINRKRKPANTTPEVKNNLIDPKTKAAKTKSEPEVKNNLVGRKPKHPNRYFLQFAPPSRSESNRVNVSFKKLAEMVCTMRLPASSWKVTVMMNRNSTSVFQFSNAKPARIVAFSESGPSYKIVMDGVPVTLLGCPKSVDTIRDIELLLDIVSSLSLRDCMVLRL